MNDVIVHSGPLYAATETLIARILSRFGASYVDFPAEASRDQMDAILARARDMAAKQGGKVAMVYLESPANPTNALVAVPAMRAAVDAAFAQDPRPPIAIDKPFHRPPQSDARHVWDNVAESVDLGWRRT